MGKLVYGGMGWQRDLPDFRDYTRETPKVATVLTQSAPLQSALKIQPAAVDLRRWCSPVEDQEQLGSCTANAGVGLLEYYQQRAFGKHLDGSRLFLYKVTRKLLGWTGDVGAYLRTTMKGMVLFGIPPEDTYPYDIQRYDEEPPAFTYAFAGSYKAVGYYRLDPTGSTTKQILDHVRTFLAAGLPSMFGFSVYSSMPRIGEKTDEIPYPEDGDSLRGGHAVMAVGYDDNRRINRRKGAFLIRNSWGPDWGDEGYGWLPYAYVTNGLAVDFWSLIDAGFVDTDLFK